MVECTTVPRGNTVWYTASLATSTQVPGQVAPVMTLTCGVQVEAEVKPFKGVLLGLFFLCTGASVDVSVLLSRFPTIALLTVGLLCVKFTITAVSARLFGLSEGESVKVGLTLSQGGEFAFVLLALAQVLPLLVC